jgi:hypothetical protein
MHPRHAAEVCESRLPEARSTRIGDYRLARDGPDRDTARSVLISVILGGMCDGFEGWDNWPIDPERLPEGARRDAEQARHLAEYLKLDHAGWLHMVWQAKQLARRPKFRSLTIAIANELERVEVLTADDLKVLITSTEEAWNT